MLRKILILTLFSSLSLTSLAQSDEKNDEKEPVDVSIGNQRKEIGAILKSDLDKRITTLEKAVTQLQEKIAKLEKNVPIVEHKTCILTTPFNGDFEGRDPDILKATEKAQEACLLGTNNNAAICARRNITCKQ